MATVGNRNWFPTETTNIAVSQLGFEVISIASTSLSTSTIHTIDSDKEFVIAAIQNVNTHNIEVQAQKLDDVKGDDLSTTGEYNPLQSRWLTMYPEDIIYGRFEKVALKKPTSGTDYLKLTKGVR
jgi:hypothetical protein